MLYSSNLPLGVPNWTVIYTITHRHSKDFFWRRCRGKRRLLQGEFRTHILYFVLSFAFTLFLLASFYQKHKKISFLYSCYFFTLSSLCCFLGTFWRTSQ
jgi:hypothetical protein